MESELFHAIEYDDFCKVKTLLTKYDIDINEIDEDGKTPLIKAAENGYLNIVKLLIEKGADIEATDRTKRTPLIYACFNNYLGIVKFLVEKGANIEAEDIDKITPLSYACMDNFKIAKFLIEKGALINKQDKDGDTALMVAVDNINFNLVKFLLEKGADLNFKDKYGNTAYDLAGSINMKKLLKKYMNNSNKFNIKLPEKDIFCFDEILQCDILVKDFVKSNNNILIKFGENIKGYDRSEIIKYYDEKKTLYCKESLLFGEVQKLKNEEYLFFSTVDTGINGYVLVPQSLEKFFS